MGEPSDTPKAVCFTYWLPNHNNVRYAALFPRLASVVHFHKIAFSQYRMIMLPQYHLWRAFNQRLIYPTVLQALSRKHRVLFTVDASQIPFWQGSVVADIDDPTYDPTEVDLLNLPQVKAIVVTTERAKQMYQDLGVDRAIHVIPQGIALQIDPANAREVRRRYKEDSDLIIGYVAPTLTLSDDGPRRFRHGLDDLDLLLTAVEEAMRAEPRLKLWLLGRPSASVRRLSKNRAWIKLVGYVPFSDVLNYVSNFDIGAYPRTVILPPGRMSIKLAQYMSCGIPVVSMRVNEAFLVQEAKSGLVCGSQEEFSRSLVSLAASPEMRARLGAAGRRYARLNLDWSQLIPRYEALLMDVLRPHNAPSGV